MRMYRGDLRPPLTITLRDGTTPLDLTTATSIHVIGYKNGKTFFRREVEGTDEGVVTMEWQVGDTDNVGRIEVEVEVMWPDDKPQTFRPVEAVDVVQDWG